MISISFDDDEIRLKRKICINLSDTIYEKKKGSLDFVVIDYLPRSEDRRRQKRGARYLLDAAYSAS